MNVTGNPVTLYVTLLVVPSSLVVTTAVVLAPSTKFTVSYGFTKSFAVPLFCKFQPAFNTSDTVAALLPANLGFGFPSFVGFNKSAASAAVIGAAVLFLPSIGLPSTSYAFLSASFTVGKLLFTLFNVVGVVVWLFGAASELATLGFTKLDFNGFAAVSIGLITFPSLSTKSPSSFLPTTGLPASLTGSPFSFTG